VNAVERFGTIVGLVYIQQLGMWVTRLRVNRAMGQMFTLVSRLCEKK